MDTVYGLLALAAILGGIGLVLGLLVGLGVVRWAGASRRVACGCAAALMAVILAIGAWQTTTVRTEPTSNADAKAHDYSLSGLEIALAIWATLVNAGGAAVGVYLPLRRHDRQPQPPHDPVEPLRP